jgi:hypothetical protein
MTSTAEVPLTEANESACEKLDKRPETGNSHDRYSVWWNEPEDKDPENPLNWPNGRKWGIIGILSLLTFLTYVQT